MCYWVTRKMTGRVVGRNVPDSSLDTFLSVLPTGCYGIEDVDGNEITFAVVRKGCVEYHGVLIGAVVLV
jgi:hypothetical protein